VSVRRRLARLALEAVAATPAVLALAAAAPAAATSVMHLDGIGRSRIGMDLSRTKLAVLPPNAGR
jgi:hypothetical protein